MTLISPEPHIPATELSQPGCHQGRSHKPVYLALLPSMPTQLQHPYDNPATSIPYYILRVKKIHAHSYPYLCKTLNVFQNSFTDTLCRKSAIKQSLKIPRHLKHVVTLPSEILVLNRAVERLIFLIALIARLIILIAR